ncbi:MAG TPA: energy transducer TonB [Candidatus Methanoperedens sp.]|nr:energy transducer TonB [Candidatus Methanoperedens sp.]
MPENPRAAGFATADPAAGRPDQAAAPASPEAAPVAASGAFASAATEVGAASAATAQWPGGTAAGGPVGASAAGPAGAGGNGGFAAPAAGFAPAAAPDFPRGPSSLEIAALRRRIDARKVYPQIAIRNGWEGRVLVEMHLDVDGHLAAVRLVDGSGYAILDEATITAVRLASPFPPIARVVTVPVEYRLIP